ncbi:MAG: 2-oxoacid:acceptor oxidoreductase family protein, partial [Candidatus Micrarchaeota archaeon]
AAQFLAEAAFFDGKYAQAFPFYGVERTGAPIQAFCRISDKRIRLHEHVYAPDYLIVLDDTLVEAADVFAGMKKGLAVIASDKKIKAPKGVEVKTVDAYPVARKIMGNTIVNTLMVAAFAKATGLVSLDGLIDAVNKKFPKPVADKNIEAMREIFQAVK